MRGAAQPGRLGRRCAERERVRHWVEREAATARRDGRGSVAGLPCGPLKPTGAGVARRRRRRRRRRVRRRRRRRRESPSPRYAAACPGRSPRRLPTCRLTDLPRRKPNDMRTREAADGVLTTYRAARAPTLPGEDPADFTGQRTGEQPSYPCPQRHTHQQTLKARVHRHAAHLTHTHSSQSSIRPPPPPRHHRRRVLQPAHARLRPEGLQGRVRAAAGPGRAAPGRG